MFPYENLPRAIFFSLFLVAFFKRPLYFFSFSFFFGTNCILYCSVSGTSITSAFDGKKIAPKKMVFLVGSQRC